MRNMMAVKEILLVSIASVLEPLFDLVSECVKLNKKWYLFNVLPLPEMSGWLVGAAWRSRLS